MSAVDGPVHVNGHGRNQKRRMVKRYQLGNNLPVIFYKQTSYYGKRTVKPGTHNHSAIAFYIETGVFAVPLNLPGIFFTDFRESCIEKGCFDMTDRMKNKRGFTDKVQ